MQFQDIHLSDTQLYTLFRQYYTQGRYQDALNILSQNPQLDTKAILADNINDLNERIHGFENVYYVEVEQYLGDLLQSMQVNVNNLSNQNEYNPTKQYYEKNFVFYNKEIYFCIKMPKIGTLPTNQEYWLKLGLFGEKGKYGISNLSFVGQWNENNLYTTNQVVLIDRTFYWAIQNNQGQNPTITPNEYWGILFTVEAQKIIVAESKPTDLITNDFWFEIAIDKEEQTRYARS